MENSSNHTFADLSRFMKRSPKLLTYMPPLLLFLFLDYLTIKSMALIVEFFIIPLLLIILGDQIFISLARFNFPRRRVYFLDFTSFFIFNTYFLILSVIFSSASHVVLAAMAISATALMRSMVFYVYYSEKIQLVILPAMLYSLISLLIFSIISYNSRVLVGTILSAAIFSLGGLAFAFYSIRKFRKEFGLSPIKILNFFLNIHSEEDQSAGHIFFSNLYGTKREVPVKVISIDNMEGKRKVLLVFPYVHPGPFGEIGTSNLPFKIYSRTSDISQETMVFHTSTTNSNNCASDADVDSLAEGVRKSLESLHYSDKIARLRKIKSGKIAISLLRIGDFGVGSVIPERERFDDVSLPEGLKITERVVAAGAYDFAVVDAQNHFSYRAKPLDDCETHSKTFEREFNRDVPKYDLMVGYSHLTAKSPGLGSMGIQTLVFRVGDKDQAIVLTDSNNIKDEVMAMAEEKVAGKVAYLDIFTTDNHFVNQSTLDMNPLGERDDVAMISDLIAESIDIAIKNVEPCRAGMGSSNVTVSMGEENMFEKLLTNVFKSLKRAKYSIVAVVVLTIALSFVVFNLPFLP
jgi:putative membrane protein